MRTEPKRALPLLLAATALAYLAALLGTDATFLGDAPDYARQVAARLLGRNCEYWDFGHLLWRPLGVRAYWISGRPLAGTLPSLCLSILRQLTAVAQFAGAVGALATALWLWRRTACTAGAAYGVSLLLFSAAFLNYAQTGTAYIPALALLMAALATLSAELPPERGAILRALVGGGLLAGSVLFWFPMVLAVPAVIASILVLDPAGSRPARRIVAAVAAFTLSAGAAVVFAGERQGFEGLADYREWLGAAGHGITGFGGVPRAVLGFARSFVDLGDYGQVLKRSLMDAPAHPVRVEELLSIHLLQGIGFYLGFLLVAALAARSRAGRRALLFFALLAVPVAGFAVVWQGGDLERYLALTPGVVLIGAEAYKNARPFPGLRAALLGCVAVMIVSNAAVMAVPRVARVHAPARERLAGWSAEAPARGTPVRRLLIVSDSHDGVAEFHRNFPWHPANRAALGVYPLVTPGMPAVAEWRRGFEREVAAAWQSGTEVWVSERLVESQPRAGSDWIEGDPASLPWARLHEVFSRLQYGRRAGPPGDGFLALEPAAHNWEVFAEVESAPWLEADPPGCVLPLEISADPLPGVP